MIHSEGHARDDDDDDAFVIVQQEPVAESVQDVAQDDDEDEHGAMMRKINEIKVCLAVPLGPRGLTHPPPPPPAYSPRSFRLLTSLHSLPPRPSDRKQESRWRKR